MNARQLQCPSDGHHSVVGALLALWHSKLGSPGAIPGGYKAVGDRWGRQKWVAGLTVTPKRAAIGQVAMSALGSSRVLPTAFTAYCPLFEPTSADRPHNQCLVRSLPTLSLVIFPFTVRSGPLDSWTLSGQACIPVCGQPHVMHAEIGPKGGGGLPLQAQACLRHGLRGYVCPGVRPAPK